LEKGSFAASPADFSVRQYTQYEVTQASLLWAMTAALGLHREAALPVPLHKGLTPSVLFFASIFTHHTTQKGCNIFSLLQQKSFLSVSISAI